MKLKYQPEDFRVEELPLVTPDERGRFAFYRLRKRGMGTPEVLEAIRRRWNLAGAQIHYGGLKDRHAETVQYLTILNGPNRVLRETSFALEPLGRLSHPYGPSHFRGNRFIVVLRDLTESESRNARRVLDQIPHDGLPNYFDDQRFGSLGFGGDFIAEAWLKGDHERALFLAIAEATPMDRASTRKEKVLLREFWGRWAEAKAALDRSHARSLVTYLVDHPTDYRGAFARLRRDLRSIYFSAYQSFLWNRILARLIEQVTRPDQRTLIDFKVGPLPLHRDLTTDQARTLTASRVPLPASRTSLPEETLVREIALEVVRERGLEWNDLRVKHLKDVFFSKGSRPALFFPDHVSSNEAEDEFHPGQRKVELQFELPKGAYATLIVKRVTEAA